MDVDKCGTCGQAENFPADPGSELRPYGDGGAFICYRCAFATPENEARTEANFHAIAEASIAATGVHVIAARPNSDSPAP